MKYHDNDVYILADNFSLFMDDKGSYGSFVINDSKVTSGQDPDGHIAKRKEIPIGSDGKLVFRVGRKGSDDVAEWWCDTVRPECNTFNKNPEELNFAVKGTLTMNAVSDSLGIRCTIVYDDVCMAQGHTAGRNNWWFGGAAKCYFHNIYEATINSSVVVYYGRSVDGKKVIRTTVDRSELGTSVNTYTFRLKDVTDCIYAGWMKNFCNRKLKDLVLPGSHDTGMSEVHHRDFLGLVGTEAVVTQDKSIYEQLLCGCRYFDIRVDYDHGELVTYHRTSAIGANGQSISDVFHQIREFLEQYTEETIIMKVSHIRSYEEHNEKDTTNRFADYATKYFDDILYRTDEGTNLHELVQKDCAGKVIMVCDFYNGFDKYDHHTGIFKYCDVGNEIVKNLPLDQMNVFDDYSNTMVYSEMKEDQWNKWENNAGQSDTKLFLLSWTMTVNPSQIVDEKTLSVKKMAENANKHLTDELNYGIQTLGLAKPNIVYIDFIDEKLCGDIISHNEK